jgi:iron complex transport system permease protein
MSKNPQAEKQEIQSRIRLNMEYQAGTVFAQAEQKRFNLSRHSRRTVWLGIAMLVIFALSVVFCGNMMNPNFSLAWVLKYALRRLQDIIALFSGAHTQSGIGFFLCQFATPIIAGLALGASGACYQGVFRNPMASPTLLGVESGGALGATVYILFIYQPTLAPILSTVYGDYTYTYFKTMGFFERYGAYFATFLGCIAMVGLVMLIAKASRRGRLDTVTLMIGGSIFTAAISTLINLIQYYQMTIGGNSAVITQIQALQSGNFVTVSTPEMLLQFTVPVLSAFILLSLLGGRLNIIAFGEDEARMMGVNTGKMRIALLLLATVMTAAVVSFCGTIGFVGLICPHFARMLVGNDFRRLIPASGFIGGVFILLAYNISYAINMYLNAGSIINILGGIIFAVFLIYYRRQGNADWA